MSEPRCMECGRSASEIDEYVDNPEGMGAAEFARTDGTYNPITDHFWCTECYVRIGMPLGKAR